MPVHSVPSASCSLHTFVLLIKSQSPQGFLENQSMGKFATATGSKELADALLLRRKQSPGQKHTLQQTSAAKVPCHQLLDGCARNEPQHPAL